MSEDQKAADRVGELFGPYRLDELLGRGGMGEVYRAHDTSRDRDVALKLLHAGVAADETFQERFRRECQTLARLGEPHVIPIHDFGEIDGTLYLDMRIVAGRDLRAVLRAGGPLEPARAVGLIEQIAAALDAAHEAGLVHRDVKPENILVTDADFAYLVDFGVAHADNDTHLTRTGTAIGSVAYMSPEQFEDGDVGPSTDVYSLAAVFFELLTGRQPYRGESISTVMRGVLLDPVPSAAAINSAVGEPLDAVVAWGLAKAADDRCPSAGALADAARKALAGEAPPGGGTRAVSLDKTSGETMVAPRRPVPQQPAGPVVSGPVPAVSGPTQVGYAPGYPYPGYASGPVLIERRQSTANIVMMVIIGVLLAALVGGGVWYIADRLEGDDPTTTQAGTTPGQNGDANNDTQATPTQGATPTADGPTTTTTAATTTATYTPGPPPADNQQCYEGVGTGYPQWTGCEFARNVRDAYVASGPLGEYRTVNGWAPEQRKYYVMECGPYAGIVACRGGNQAVVYVY